MLDAIEIEPSIKKKNLSLCLRGRRGRENGGLHVSMDTIRKFFILTDDGLFWTLRSLVWACVAGLEKRWEQSRTSSLRPLLRMLADRWSSGTKTLSMRVRWEKKPVCHLTLSPPSPPQFCARHAGPEKPFRWLSHWHDRSANHHLSWWLYVSNLWRFACEKAGRKTANDPQFQGRI